MAPPNAPTTTKSSKGHEEEDRVSVLEQLRDFRGRIPKDLLMKWETPTGLKSLRFIGQDWALILLGYYLFMRQPGILSLSGAVLLMAWGQRGLSNLAHDSIHRNLHSNKKFNDFLANVFLALPLMSTGDIQRKLHTAHHHYLGTKDDPDHGLHNETSMKHYRNGRFDHKTIPSLFVYDFFDIHMMVNYSLGSFASAPFQLSTYWALVTLIFGWKFTVLFHLARCTISYACYIFREIIDHSGLPSNTILEFTRTSPCCNPVQKFLQPHDDNFHLLHHLLPKIPMSNLHESHTWLVGNVPEYEKANRHMTYFSGENPLFLQSLHTHENFHDGLRD